MILLLNLINHRVLGCVRASLCSIINVPPVPFPDLPGAFDISGMFPMLFTIMGLMILFIFMVYFFGKMRIFPLILIVYLISLVVAVGSIIDSTIPYSSNIELIFLLLQSCFFFLTLVEFIREVKKLK